MKLAMGLNEIGDSERGRLKRATDKTVPGHFSVGKAAINYQKPQSD